MSANDSAARVEAGLFAVSPLDGRYQNKTSVLRGYFSEFALIKARVEIEIRYFLFLTELGIVPAAPDQNLFHLPAIYQDFSKTDALRVKEIENRTRHDVKAVEYFLQEWFDAHALGNLKPWIHFALTSDDINNLAHRLLLRGFLADHLWPAFERLLKSIRDLAASYRAAPMLARTHGQPAVPTTFGKELAVFAARLEGQLDQGRRLRFQGKFAGAVGSWNAHQAALPDRDWPALCRQFLASLGLDQALPTTQIAPPEDLVACFHLLLRIHGILLDLNQDFWRYISDGWLVLKTAEGQVGSSTMPQKVNPIDFENSEGNLVIANGLLETLARKLPASRLQRDLSESTVMRNIGTAFGHGYLAVQSLQAGLGKIALDEAAVGAALDQNWNILSEAAQTAARMEGKSDAYEQVASRVKESRMDAEGWARLVEALGLSPSSSRRLLELTPRTYLGLSAGLVEIENKDKDHDE